jgi:hypothetical protein
MYLKYRLTLLHQKNLMFLPHQMYQKYLKSGFQRHQMNLKFLKNPMFQSRLNHLHLG